MNHTDTDSVVVDLVQNAVDPDVDPQHVGAAERARGPRVAGEG
ncbi:hypothetical protein [Streptomyces longisporoflavus]|nr:hypothetical protein [Streptomyces longisporoflavus]